MPPLASPKNDDDSSADETLEVDGTEINNEMNKANVRREPIIDNQSQLIKGLNAFTGIDKVSFNLLLLKLTMEIFVSVEKRSTKA